MACAPRAQARAPRVHQRVQARDARARACARAGPAGMSGRLRTVVNRPARRGPVYAPCSIELNARSGAAVVQTCRVQAPRAGACLLLVPRLELLH